MRNLLAQLLAVGPELAAYILSSPILFARTTYAITPTSVPSPNLDLSQLGRVALAGDFNSISLYQYVGQNEDFSTNGSQSLLTRYPNGAFQTLDRTDAYIETMCPFMQNGKLQGVVVGGNFTSLGGQQANGIALWNPDNGEVTPLPGLSGRVQALYCDDDSGTVYVGGSFNAGNSTNAMAWTTGWSNLPFAGFNGPVSTIIKNAAGNIVFGGSFTGLGNTTTPTEPDQQVINLSSGNVTSSGTSSTDGFDDPRNIICKTGSQDGSGNTWLLQDNTAGYWEGAYYFGFNPTRLRLYNTQYEGRGTRTFYFEDMNSGGILNMQYDDADGNNQSCSARCPLAQNTSSQDFHFQPPVGMNSFRINIVEWYGSGGGLSGIEMFQNDMYSFAVDNFNEPQCADLSQGSSSSVSPANGTWNRTYANGQTSSDYLTAFLTNPGQISSDTSVTFMPDIRQSGNYSIMVYTPGCIQDNSCATRGQVNLTASVTSDQPPVSTTLYQTNYYDKFDTIYFGQVDADSDSFRPTVALSPASGQNTPLTVVAQRVRFELTNSSSGLNGLFEYNPNQAQVNTDFTQSAIDSAGKTLALDAAVNSIVSYNSRIFVAGNFSGGGMSNVMSVGDNATALPGGGLNSEVLALFQNGSTLYMGGNFSNTANSTEQGLNSIAVFDADSSTWSALGAGVNGPVFSIVPLPLNITEGEVVNCITFSGSFTSVNAFGDNKASNATGLAVWVPGRNNWLNNIPEAIVQVSGQLVSYTTVPGSDTLYAGSITSLAGAFSDAVQMTGSGQPTLSGLGVQIQPRQSSSSGMQKRALDPSGDNNATGVYGGLYYDENKLNITVLGGSFTAIASNGSTIENLMFINNTESTQTITGIIGLDSDSIFVAMDTVSTLLFAGGAISGTVNGNPARGVAVIDLSTGDFAANQPPALGGRDVVIVNAVATQPDSQSVYVGGDFATAGALPCETLCYYDNSARQWNTPGSGLQGSIAQMTWISKTQLVLAGNLTVSGNKTTMATYDSKSQTFQTYTAADSLPGSISALSPATSDYNAWWAAGTATNNNTAYLSKYSSGTWTSVSGLGSGTSIRGLQVMSLTSDHDSSALMPSNQALMLTGNLNIPSFGNCSAALFNGTTFTPFILTSSASGNGGSLSRMFVSNPANLMSGGGHHLALGLVVLIGLAIALGLIFILVLAGILLERARRKREGYIPMSKDRGNGNLSRIPPETLLGGLQEKNDAPKL